MLLVVAVVVVVAVGVARHQPTLLRGYRRFNPQIEAVGVARHQAPFLRRYRGVIQKGG